MSGDDAEDDDWFESAVGSDEDEADDAPAADTEAVDAATADTETVDAEAADPDVDVPDVNDESAAEADSAFGPEGGFGAEDSGTGPDFGGGGSGPGEGGSSPGESGSGAGAAGGGGGEGGIFDDDFASAFDASGGDDEFSDEDFETDIPRIDLGIEGLDQMIQGGVPQRHLMTAIGSAGTGKTTFGLQFLYHGLQQDQKGVFITLEQSREAILDTANEWGWDFEAYEDDDELAIVDLDPVEMANSLDNIRGELPKLIEDFDADRLVLDSVSLLEMMYDDQSKRRTEVFDFTRSLKDAGVTTFLTSEASENNPYASRFGIIEYLTDAVFVLQYVRSESRETRLAVEIQKIRNANHSREKKPYEITSEGISVYQQANIF